MDLSDVTQEAERRFGKQLDLCKRSSYNPNTRKYYGFCHGWIIDPGDYRKSLWEKVGKPEGPDPQHSGSNLIHLFPGSVHCRLHLGRNKVDAYYGGFTGLNGKVET